ncbi:S16 family serine protease [Escherichia coli]
MCSGERQIDLYRFARRSDAGVHSGGVNGGSCACGKTGDYPDFYETRHPRPRTGKVRTPKDGPSAGIAMCTALVLAGELTGSCRCGNDR